jgi:hypothetical protein
MGCKCECGGRRNKNGRLLLVCTCCDMWECPVHHGLQWWEVKPKGWIPYPQSHRPEDRQELQTLKQTAAAAIERWLEEYK